MITEGLISARTGRKLSALRLRLRAHLLTGGASCLATALVGAVFLTLAVDYLLRLDRSQRGVVAAAALAGVGYVLWRFLLRPLRVPMGAEELALVLEKHYPHLHDRLISALQFARSPTSRLGASEALILRVAGEANELAGVLDPAAPVGWRQTRRRVGLGAAAAGALAVFTAFHLSLMNLWFQRNVLFADVDWPRQTYLTVQGGSDFRVVRGGRLEVVVTADADHVVPGAVTFHMRFPGLGTVPESVAPVQAGGNAFVKVFENVTDAFEFYVTGNDDRTPACRVTTLDAPELANVTFTVIEPAYMNPAAEGRAVSAAQGVLSLPPGSTLVFTGWATKDLASCRLLLDGQPAGSVRVTPATVSQDASATQRPRGLQGELALPERPGKTALTLQFELTDQEGITNRRGAVYALRIDPDRPPSVTMNRTGVGGQVTARATIPLVIEVRDDHGVAAVAATVTPTTRPAGAKNFPVVGIAAGQPLVRADHHLDLQPLQLGLGELIRVQAVARDTLPESFGGPNVGLSPVQTFKVVSDEELMEELVRRQKEIRQDFARVVVLQSEIRDRVRALADRLAAAPALEADAGRVLSAAAADQRRVAAQCAVAAGQLQGVLDEMIYNRVGPPAEQRRLSERIIAPLLEICKKPMTDVAAAADQASKDTDLQATRRFTADAAGVFDGFYQRLDEILREMKELESRQELANQLKRIIEWSEELRERIARQVQRQGGLIFDSTTQPTQPAPPG